MPSDRANQIRAELIRRELARREQTKNVNPFGTTSSPEDYLPEELMNTKMPSLKAGMSVKDYFTQAQPAFKLAIEHPETLFGQNVSPQDIEKTTSGDYADIYRRAGLPGSGSTSVAGQLVPQAAGMLLDIGTRPSSVITAGVAEASPALMQTKAGQEFAKFMTRKRSLPDPMKNVKRVTNVKEGAQFAEDVRGEFVKTKVNAVESFGKDLDSLVTKFPNNKISFNDIVSNISGSVNEISKEAMGIFNKTPYLRDALAGKRTNFTVKEVQDAINYLNTKVPKNIRANNLDVLDVISDLKASQLNAFPEEMAAARSSYAKVIEPYNNLKTQFRFNKLLKAIENNFGGAEGRKAVEGLLPKNVVNEIGGYQKAYETLVHLRKIAPYVGIAVAGSAGGYVGGRIVQGMTNPP